jgi:hypothetical protein
MYVFIYPNTTYVRHRKNKNVKNFYKVLDICLSYAHVLL